MFRRRIERTLLQKAREFVFPTSGYRRAMLYLWRRLMRLNASPHTVALGFAIGVFMSFSPFLGLHLVLSGLFAWLLRANIAASMLGNFLGNPVTYPPMWMAVYGVGDYLLGSPQVVGEAASRVMGISFSWDIFLSWEVFLNFAQEIFLPFLVGSIPVGILAGLVFYIPVKQGVSRYQASRRDRFYKIHPALAVGAMPSQTGELG